MIEYPDQRDRLPTDGKAAVLAAKNTTLPSLNLYPFPTRRLDRRGFRLRGLQIIPTRVTLPVGCRFRGLRPGFYTGDQIIVYVLVPAVKMALVDDLAAGAKTDQIGDRFTPSFVVVEKGVDHRMPVKKRNGFGKVDDRVQHDRIADRMYVIRKRQIREKIYESFEDHDACMGCRHGPVRFAGHRIIAGME